ncbi:glycosyltransferase [Pseudomonadota bacterium 24LQ007]
METVLRKRDYVLKGKTDLLIINRSFWPIYPVIGEALLQLAEKLARNRKVGVVMQDHVGIKARLIEEQRGQKVDFYPGKAWSSSSSGLVVRALDSVYFMCWVALILLRNRPRTVYVSTDPPVLVPFVVMLYARLFRARYIYHLQDIHPEAANTIVRVNPLVYRLLFWMDGVTMRKADALITITDEMAHEIKVRSKTSSPVHVISNPAVSFDEVVAPDRKISGFSFCGNAGRLQRIPLLLSAIRKYLDGGGRLQFAFAGGGVFAQDIAKVASIYDQVEYLGQVSAGEAAQLNCGYEWALLPIEDEVTRYAFPSKTSSYVFSEAAIAAVCGSDTSVAEWVTKHHLGIVVPPGVDELVDFFWQVERGEMSASMHCQDRSELMAHLRFDRFVDKLLAILPLDHSTK